MSTPLLTPTPLAAPSGPTAAETSLATTPAAYCLDGEVQAVVTNAPGGPDQPCRVELWLSKDGGITYVRGRMRWTSTGPGATYRVSFALGDYAEVDRLADWTHFYLRFAGNRQDARPTDGAVTVSAFADGTTWDTGGGGGGGGTLTGVAVGTANGLAGTSDGNPTTPTLSLSTTVTGILQGNGLAISAVAVGVGLSYAGGTLSATGGGGTVTQVNTGAGLTGGPINTMGTVSVATSGIVTAMIADHAITGPKMATQPANTLAGYDGSGNFSDVAIGAGLTLSGGIIATLSAGTVTSILVASANGLAGTSDGNATTPTLTLRTTVTGILQGNGTAISAITVGSGLTFSGGTLSATGGIGTVTSVGLTMPPGFTVAGSPVTSSGTLAVTTTLSGIVQAAGGAFTTVTIGSGLTYGGGTLSATGSGGTVTSLSAGTGILLAPNPITATGTIGIANGTANTLAGFNASGVFGGVAAGSGLSLSGGTLSQATIPANTIAANNTGSPAVPAGVTTGLKIDQHYGGIITPSNTSGGITFDLSQSDYFSVSLTGACTIGFANPAPSGMKQPFVIEMIPGGNTIIWAAGVSWPGGTTPTPSSGAGKIDLYGFVRNSTTGKYYGSVIGQNY